LLPPCTDFAVAGERAQEVAVVRLEPYLVGGGSFGRRGVGQLQQRIDRAAQRRRMAVALRRKIDLGNGPPR